MNYSSPLERVKLIKRYKRFLGDVVLPSGEEITVHTPNTGSMQGCAEPGSYIWIRNTENPKRKYIYSWEQSELASGVRVGVNTGMANYLVAEAINQGRVEALTGYANLRTEVPYGKERSRIDILLEDEELSDCYVEVKNVTARVDDYAIFPDAVSARGTKHLRELMHMVAQGSRGVIFFAVQRSDVEKFRPANEIDSLYAETLKEAVAKGVEAIAYRAEVTAEAIELVEPLPIEV